MNASELKAKYIENNPDGYYFSRGTMRFFGDTMRNYGVKDHGSYYELWRRRPVNAGLHSSAYFDSETFGILYNVDGSN